MNLKTNQYIKKHCKVQIKVFDPTVQYNLTYKIETKLKFIFKNLRKRFKDLKKHKTE